MVDVPRGKRPTSGERLGNIARSGAGLGMMGATRMAKPTAARPGSGARTSTGRLVIVEHGDDPSVGRPGVAVVYWIGAATPSNAMPYDFWYTATI